MIALLFSSWCSSAFFWGVLFLQEALGNDWLSAGTSVPKIINAMSSSQNPTGAKRPKLKIDTPLIRAKKPRYLGKCRIRPARANEPLPPAIAVSPDPPAINPALPVKLRRELEREFWVSVMQHSGDEGWKDYLGLQMMTGRRRRRKKKKVKMSAPRVLGADPAKKTSASHPLPPGRARSIAQNSEVNYGNVASAADKSSGLMFVLWGLAILCTARILSEVLQVVLDTLSWDKTSL